MARYQKRDKPLMKNDFVIYSRNRDYQSILEKETYYAIGMDPAPKNFGFGIEKRSSVNLAQTITLFKFGVKWTANAEDKSIPAFVHFVNKLGEYSEWWECIEIIYIEEQMNINSDATAMLNMALTYFTIHCPDAVILQINAKIKGKVLNAPPSLSHHGMKKWAVGYAPEILAMRGDDFGLKQIKKRAGMGASANKTDDKCDVVCTIEAAEQYLREL